MAFLISFADQGTFKSQLDYLTELPNDAARRKALKDLPRGLNPTYERLLRRINETNRDTQKLVQRTLKWIAHDKLKLHSAYYSMTAPALCEATSINIGDKKRDVESIPDESEILRCCSSLIRMSVDGERFEFAHFTVAEFLRGIDDSSNGEFTAYKINSDNVLTGLAKVCLTYLNLQDFEQSGFASNEVIEDRLERYPFRRYVTSFWLDHADFANWHDKQFFELATQLYHPSKRGTFITWMQDRVWHWSFQDYPIIKQFVAEATTLHIAAMDGLSEVCQWLVENDCDVNRKTIIGTPLHCALPFQYVTGIRALEHIYESRERVITSDARERVLHVLLEAGADPNIAFKTEVGNFSPLYLALTGRPRGLALYLLQKGAIVNELLIKQLLDKLDNETNLSEDEAARFVMEHAQTLDLSQETRARVLRYSLRARASIIPALFPTSDASTSGVQKSNRDSEASLFTAAEYGQIEAVTRLLDDHHVDVNAVEDATLLTALHYASTRDQLEVVQLLIARGADPRKTDSKGRSALHHSVEIGTRCLEFYIQRKCDTTLPDDENLTVWHLAALQENIGALETLINRSDSKILPTILQNRSGLSLIACASIGGSIEVVSLLLDAGCSVSDLDSEGWTSLHHAARKRFPRMIQGLIARGADAHAMTDDGSSIVHCALMDPSSNIDEVLDIVLGTGISPFQARQDGMTPIGLLLSESVDDDLDFEPGVVLRRLSSIPNSSEEKQASLNQALGLCCQATPNQLSAQSLSAFKVLLENGADLMSESGDRKSPFIALLVRWQDQCLKHEMSAPGTRPSRPLDIATEMVLSALDKVPPEGPSQDLGTVSSLLRSALAIWNDDLIYKLLDYSPDVDKNFDGSQDSPIRYACRNGCTSLVLQKLLAMSKASSNAVFGSDLVRETCRGLSINSNTTLLELLRLGVDCHGPSPQGETALMYAAGSGNIDLVNTLLAHGSDAKARDHNGQTVGHYACEFGHLEVLHVLRHLIDWNAKATCIVRGKRIRDVTALHLAAVHVEDSMLRFLLDEDLIKDIDGVTDDGETALNLAAWDCRPENVSLLLSKKADPTLKNKWESPLHAVARWGHVEVMAEFMKHGCNLRILNTEGLDCEMVAWKYGHVRLATMIQGHHNQRTASRSSLSPRTSSTESDG